MVLNPHLLKGENLARIPLRNTKITRERISGCSLESNFYNCFHV